MPEGNVFLDEVVVAGLLAGQGRFTAGSVLAGLLIRRLSHFSMVATVNEPSSAIQI